MDIAWVGCRQDAEDRTDLFGVLRKDLPPVEGVFCQGVLFDQKAVAPIDLLGVERDQDQGGLVDQVLSQLCRGAQQNAGGEDVFPAGVDRIGEIGGDDAGGRIIFDCGEKSGVKLPGLLVLPAIIMCIVLGIVGVGV